LSDLKFDLSVFMSKSRNHPNSLGWDEELLARLSEASGCSERTIRNNVKFLLDLMVEDEQFKKIIWRHRK